MKMQQSPFMSRITPNPQPHTARCRHAVVRLAVSSALLEPRSNFAHALPVLRCLSGSSVRHIDIALLAQRVAPAERLEAIRPRPDVPVSRVGSWSIRHFLIGPSLITLNCTLPWHPPPLF